MDTRADRVCLFHPHSVRHVKMDRINASQSIPNTHALKAYGQSLRVNKPLGAPGVSKTAPTAQPQAPQQTAPIGRIGQTQGPRPAADPTRLVAAKVNPINLSSDVASLSGPKPVMTSAGTYSIHPTAAARNTAATGVQVGRGLDLRG
ncbi:MAG: hypothetical protein JJ974_05405 [Phycisphaerales bacterium]|nr:hypothetical protein [Phycisphaerales bacterium]